MRTRKRTATVVAALALAGTTVVSPPTSVAEAPTSAPTREVLFVGNNWDGTVDVISQDGRFRRLGRINVVPDIEKRMREIHTDPVRLAYFLGIREAVGEGHDQLVDDMYTSEDGRLLVVSRPSLADVVGISLETGELVWRFEVDGHRSDHMAVSPDGRRVAVSASTANKVHVLDIRTGEEIATFPSGDTPHENVYSGDGSKIYHASIGHVYTPLDDPLFDSTKGERVFEVVDTETHELVKRIDMGEKLAEAGYPELSSAMRPMTLSPDERFVYFQVSFFHGFVEYDLEKDEVRRVARLPVTEAGNVARAQYPLDSAHHGIAMNPEGTKLCVAGTVSNYATIVSRRTFEHRELVRGKKSYWATESSSGDHCMVSWSGGDRISALSYATGEEVASVPVGDHPQRMRLGDIRTDWIREHGQRNG